MKNFLISLAFVLGMGSWASAEVFPRTTSDVITYQSKASSDIALAVSSLNVIYNTEGIGNVHESFAFLTAPTTTSILDTVLSTTDLVANATNFPNGANGINQPKYPSPLIINFDFEVGRGTYAFTSTVTVSGIDSVGSSRTVVMYVTTNVASTGFAYARISSITFSVFSTSAPGVVPYNNSRLHLNLGTTNQIGLVTDILEPSDVYATWENGTLITSATIVNAGFNTWTPQAGPNGPQKYADQFSTSTIHYEVYERVRQSPPHRIKPRR